MKEWNIPKSVVRVEIPVGTAEGPKVFEQRFISGHITGSDVGKDPTVVALKRAAREHRDQTPGAKIGAVRLTFGARYYPMTGL